MTLKVSNLNEAIKAHQAAVHLELLLPYIRSDLLVDLIGVGNVFCHLSVAASPFLSTPVIAALVEIAERDVLLVLIRNDNIALSDLIITRVIDRFGGDDDILLALESREDLDGDAMLQVFDARLRWIEKNLRHFNYLAGCEHRDSLIVIALWSAPPQVRDVYCHALTQSGRITSALLLFAFCIGARDVALCLFAHAAKVKTTLVDQAFRMRNVEAIRTLAHKARVAEILVPELIEAVEGPEPSEQKILSLAA